MASDLTRDWLRNNIRSYSDSTRVFADVDALLGQQRTLRPKTDVYTFNDGRAQLLLCIHGLLPIRFRGSQYNIPVSVWLPTDYPASPPMSYVVPTGDMLVRPSQHVDLSGELSVPYVRDWVRKTEGCHLLGLVESLQDLFSREPPLYAKPRTPPASSSASSQPSPSPAPPSRPPKPPPPPPTASPGTITSPVAHGVKTRYSTPSSLTTPPHLAPDAQSSQQSGYVPTPSPSQSLTPPPPPPPLPPIPARPHSQYGGGHGYSAHSLSTASPAQWSLSPPSVTQPQAQPLTHGQQQQQQPPRIYPDLNHPAHLHSYVPPPAERHLSSHPQPVPARPNLMDEPDEISQDPSDSSVRLGLGSSSFALPPRPPNPELLRLHTQVHQKLVSSLTSLNSAHESSADRLRALQKDLLSGEPAIRDEMARLEAVKDVCLNIVRRLGDVVREAEGRVDELRRKGDPEVDELVCSSDVVYNQLLDLVAEDNAIEDTIYHLHRAHNAGRIDLERFLRVSRALAEEQFMKRALAQKIVFATVQHAR